MTGSLISDNKQNRQNRKQASKRNWQSKVMMSLWLILVDLCFALAKQRMCMVLPTDNRITNPSNQAIRTHPSTTHTTLPNFLKKRQQLYNSTTTDTPLPQLLARLQQSQASTTKLSTQPLFLARHLKPFTPSARTQLPIITLGKARPPTPGFPALWSPCSRRISTEPRLPASHQAGSQWAAPAPSSLAPHMASWAGVRLAGPAGSAGRTTALTASTAPRTHPALWTRPYSAVRASAPATCTAGRRGR